MAQQLRVLTPLPQQEAGPCEKGAGPARGGAGKWGLWAVPGMWVCGLNIKDELLPG